MYIHQKNVLTSGTPLQEADRALVMLHGRGGTAADISSLAGLFQPGNAAVLAPQAERNSWYPYSFLVPRQTNQPALDSALEVVDALVNEILTAGLSTEQIFFAGFSQGACLTLDYIGRNARKYGGVIAFTGGFIGETLEVGSPGTELEFAL